MATASGATAVAEPPFRSDRKPDAHVVLRRPHFRLEGDRLIFLASKRPHARLSPFEVEVWNTLHREPSLGELRRRYPDDADPAVQRLLDLTACDVAETSFPPGRRRILVIEPHSDDAVLSVGGAMWLRRKECEFLIVTAGSRSNFTSYYLLGHDFFDVATITALRNAEGERAARLLGGKHVALGQPEAPLRYRDGDWQLEWFQRHRGCVSAFIGHASGEHELAAWSRTIRGALHEVAAEELWIPLGIGAHTDHELTRNACLLALLEDPSLTAGKEIRFYQEVPYAAQFTTYTASVLDALAHAGASMEPEVVSIDDAYLEKQRLASIYASQFKLKSIQADIEGSARLAGGGMKMAEKFWLLGRAPRAVEQARLFVEADVVRDAARILSAWVRRHVEAARIRVLLLAPAGRWRDDMERLFNTFPRASFDVYFSPAAGAEVDATSERIRAFPVASGTRAWCALALRLAFASPAPTLFLSGAKRLGAARSLARLWPMSDPVVLPTMDHLVRALRQLEAG